MKFTIAKAGLALVIALGGTAAVESAHAGRTSVGVGFSFGFPGYWNYPSPYYYPPAYPYYDPYLYQGYGYPSGPVTYIERGAPPAAAQPEPQQWWYYCAESRSYYPYVRECAGNWVRVSPTPPGP